MKTLTRSIVLFVILISIVFSSIPVFAQVGPNNPFFQSCTILIKARQLFYEQNGNFTNQSQSCSSSTLERELLFNQILYVTIEMNYQGFGGLGSHGSGTYHVYVTDPAQAEKIGNGTVTEILQQAGISANNVVFVKGTQNWDTWVKWQGIATQLFTNSSLGVQSVGIDQENQTLDIMLKSLDKGTVSTVDKFLDSHQIPLKMVQLTQGEIRPIPEFHFAVPILVTSIILLLVLHRIKFKFLIS